MIDDPVVAALMRRIDEIPVPRVVHVTCTQVDPFMVAINGQGSVPAQVLVGTAFGVGDTGFALWAPPAPAMCFGTIAGGAGGPGTKGTYVPIASTDFQVAIYRGFITGGAKGIQVPVFEGGTGTDPVLLGARLESNQYPSQILFADAEGGLYWADGTVDPVFGGVNLCLDDNDHLFLGGGLRIRPTNGTDALRVRDGNVFWDSSSGTTGTPKNALGDPIVNHTAPHLVGVRGYTTSARNVLGALITAVNDNYLIFDADVDEPFWSDGAGGWISGKGLHGTNVIESGPFSNAGGEGPVAFRTTELATAMQDAKTLQHSQIVIAADRGGDDVNIGSGTDPIVIPVHDGHFDATLTIFSDDLADRWDITFRGSNDATDFTGRDAGTVTIDASAGGLVPTYGTSLITWAVTGDSAGNVLITPSATTTFDRYAHVELFELHANT